MRKVTIKDVAVAAGVQPSTVSYILNNSRRGFAKETVNRVKEIAKTLGYRADTAARSLRAGTSEMVGFLFSPSVDAVRCALDYQLLGGIGVEVKSGGYDLVIILAKSVSEPDFEHLEQVIDGRRIDGLILSNPLRGSRVLPFLMGRSVPFVVIGRPSIDGICWVDSNNVKIGQMMAEHLINMGHRELVFITPGYRYAYAADREQGFAEACEQAGIDERKSWSIVCEDSQTAAAEAIRKLHGAGRLPTGICAVDDRIAGGVIYALNEIGLSIPEDVSVVGCNNLASVNDGPFLTTVELDMPRLGRLAACRLLRMLNGDSQVTGEMVEGRLVVRNSTGPARTTDG